MKKTYQQPCCKQEETLETALPVAQSLTGSDNGETIISGGDDDTGGGGDPDAKYRGTGGWGNLW